MINNGLLGAAIGSIITGGIIYSYMKDQAQNDLSEKEREIKSVKETVGENAMKIRSMHDALDRQHQFTSDIIDDIPVVSDIDDDRFGQYIRHCKKLQRNLQFCNSENPNSYANSVYEDISNIKRFSEKLVNEYEESKDPEILPTKKYPVKSITLKGIAGTKDISFVIPDTGLHLIDGTTFDENDFRFLSKDVPELDEFLCKGIEAQLKASPEYYINKDKLGDNVWGAAILVSAYIDSLDTETLGIGSVLIMLPFEIFEIPSGTEINIYKTQCGGLHLEEAEAYYNSVKQVSNSESETAVSSEEPVKDDIDIKITDDLTDYIVNVIGVNRDGWINFCNRLEIYRDINVEEYRKIVLSLVKEVNRYKAIESPTNDERNSSMVYIMADIMGPFRKHKKEIMQWIRESK